MLAAKALIFSRILLDFTRYKTMRTLLFQLFDWLTPRGDVIQKRSSVLLKSNINADATEIKNRETYPRIHTKLKTLRAKGARKLADK